HGWKYDASGQCVEMPAEDASFPPKVRIASYPTEEYLGLVFAYLGEGEAPPLPRYPDFEADGVLEVSSYVRPCNYFNNVENGLDHIHLAFVHRLSPFTDAGLNWDLPRIEADETDWGIEQRGIRSNGVVRYLQYGMPNVLHIKGSPNDGDSGWVDALSWRVPIDDVTHHSCNVNLVHVTGAAAERYRQRRREPAPPGAAVNDLAAAVLRSELHTDDLKGHPAIVNIQDTVAQAGQGAIADREHERLGRSDVAVILLRKLWARELAALAEGRPLKQWTRSAQLVATSGV
ncbi:MAG TPA: Rieske (2Fe-2S) protein, partial [Chloroflexota bacterium]|nr:Rieske (2Fe-2S) protein [Chloroflexota bacterium]